MENKTMSEPTNKKIKYIIADTSAFINAVQLNDYAENVLTVPDVMTEVRNKRQIRRLCVLPFDLQVQEPRTESVKHCVEFAKKTGDYASLSGIDIKVIALTYELEADHVGTDHLRKEPVVSQIIASKEKPDEFKDNTKLAGWYNPKKGSRGSEESDESDEDNEDDEDDAEDGQGEESDDGAGSSSGDNVQVDGESKVDTVKEAIEKQLAGGDSAGTLPVNTEQEDDVTQEELDKLFEKLKCESAEDDGTCELLVPERQPEEDEDDDDDLSEDDDESDRQDNLQTDKLSSAGDADADAGMEEGDWITPANIKKVKKSLEGKVEDDIIPTVACMSTDYALQNVLKQMNLHVAALNGRIIKHLRTYILRCYACFKTTSIMTKVFCPNCGNKTLKRVAVSLDENGKQVIHINTRRPLSTKYKNQSIPRFRGGKHSRNPIMFEDQPIPRQMASRVAKTKTNVMEETYMVGFSPFVMRDVDSKSAMLRSKGNLKEWARNNTFEEDRRKKRYNRLYK